MCLALNNATVKEHTNKRKGWILHFLENHLAVAHHQPNLDLLAKTGSCTEIRYH